MPLKKATGSDTALRHIEPREYPRDLGGLCAQLADADAGMRRWAARDLAAHAEAAPRLAARLRDEADTSVRAVLFSSLASIGGSEVVEGMLPLLHSEDPALRNGAIEVLAACPEAVAPRIEALLNDADSDVRIFSINLLGQLAHPQVPQWLAQVLQHETEANVVGAALEVLAEVGGPEMAGALRQIKTRFADDPFIGFSADLTLQRIEAP